MPVDLPDLVRAELFEAAAIEAAAIEENEIAEGLARQARESFLRVGEVARASTVSALIGSLWRRDAQPVSRRMELARSALAEAETLGPGAGRDRARIDALFELAINQLYARDANGARASVQELGSLATTQEGDRGAVEVRWLEAVSEAIVGDIADGLDSLSEVAVRAQEIGYEELCVTAYRDASTIAARTMDYRRSRAWLTDGLRYADTYEQSHCGHVMTAVGALVAWAEGRWIDAIASGEQAIADGGCARGIVIARTALGYVFVGRGVVERAKAHLEEALEIARRSEEIDLLLPVMWGQAELAVVAGDAPGGARRCEAAFELAATVGERTLLAPFVVTGIRSLQASGRPDEAERWLERLAAQLGDSPVAVPALDHAAGLVRLAGGSVGAARDALERAVDGWQERGRTWETTWARLDLASCLLRMNRHAEAMTVLGTARATAAGLDSEPLLARADELMRVARGRGMTEEPWRPLTVR